MRYGLVTTSVGESDAGHIFYCYGLNGVSVLDALYEKQANDALELFSDAPSVLVSRCPPSNHRGLTDDVRASSIVERKFKK